MDHLPFPQGVEPPKVHFVSTDYDNGQFSGYPRRQGMDRDLRTWSFTRLPPETYQAFFQTWLYFGCLTEVFKTVGVPIDIEELVNRQEALVSSAILHTYLEKWRNVSSTHKGKKRRQVIGRVRDIIDVVINTLRGPLQAFRRLLEQHPDGPVTASWPNIVLGIAALGYTIQRVSDHLYAFAGIGAQQCWGVNWVLRARMERSQWCKALITKFLQGMGFDFLVFISSMPFPRAVENHDECEETVCRGKIADVAAYRVAHVSEPCRCEFWDMPSSSIDVIRKGGIPLISWSDHEGLRVVEYQENMPYVAISHVWSDGKGNPYRNALPRCQLRRIQSKVKGLYDIPRTDARPPELMFGPSKTHGPRDPHRQPVGFWMDTLCVPVADEHRGLRSKAIGQMRSIYEAADRVLVLDDRIEQLATSSSICDRVVRLLVSNWHGRLWTLQEGIMAQQLCFQFGDAALTLDELGDEERRQRAEDSPSPGFWHRVSHKLPELLSLPLVFGGDAEKPGVDTLFQALMIVARNRQSSNLEDETVCLATLLRLDPRPLLDIRSKYSSQARDVPTEEREAEARRVCDERMRRLLCTIGLFRKSLIFNRLPRLSTDGFRWAPRSFLGQSGEIEAIDLGRLYEGCEDRASILFTKRGPTSEPNGSCHTAASPDPNTALGLFVTHPGIMLHSLSPLLVRTGRFYVRERAHAWFQYRVSLTLSRPEEMARFDSLENEGNRYAIITISAGDCKGDGPIAAVFGVFRGVTEDGMRKFGHLFSAKVEVVDGEGEGLEEQDDGDESDEGAGWEEDDEAEEEQQSCEGNGKGGEFRDDGSEQDIAGGVDDGYNQWSDETATGEEESNGDVEEGDGHLEQSDEDFEWSNDNSESNEEAESDEREWSDNSNSLEESKAESEGSGKNTEGVAEQRDEDDSDDSDDDYLLESDGDGEDDKYAVRMGSNNKQANIPDKEPRQEQVVWGKVLFSRNNKWLVI